VVGQGKDGVRSPSAEGGASSPVLTESFHSSFQTWLIAVKMAYGTNGLSRVSRSADTAARRVPGRIVA